MKGGRGLPIVEASGQAALAGWGGWVEGGPAVTKERLDGGSYVFKIYHTTNLN